MEETAVRKHKVPFSRSMKMFFSTPQHHPPYPSSNPQPSGYCWDSRRECFLSLLHPFMLFIHLAMDFHRFSPRQRIYSSQKTTTTISTSTWIRNRINRSKVLSARTRRTILFSQWFGIESFVGEEVFRGFPGKLIA